MNIRDPKTPVYKEQLAFGFLPTWIGNDSWRAYKKYWIDTDYQPPSIENRPTKDFNEGSYLFDLDMVEVHIENHNAMTFKRGKYIRWEYNDELDDPEFYDELTSYTIYKISEHPNIFMEFAKIGKIPDPKDSTVLAFVKKYGVPNRYIIPEYYGWGSICYGHGYYPFNTFCYYANEAHYCFSLYQALLSKNINNVRESLLNGLNYSCLRKWIQEFYDEYLSI